jgi:hypothetical protein
MQGKPIPDLIRETGTGYEVWYIRDEWVRDHEVLHPHWGVLYKSGVYASKVTCFTLVSARIPGVKETRSK